MRTPAPRRSALERLGVTPVRGSGGPADRAYYKGGVPAMRQLLPPARIGRVGRDDRRRAQARPRRGLGIVTLAKLSGRPIVPTAVVTSRRIQFDSWDRASLGLPFSRAVVVAGDLVRVAHDADDAAIEAARLAVQQGLDERTNGPTRWSARPIRARI